MNMNRKYYLGIDVGGTKIAGAVADLNVVNHKIKIYGQKRIETRPEEGIDKFINSIVHLINDLLAEAKLSETELCAIGLGLPGSLDPQTKIMINGNTQFLVGQDVMGKLQKKLKWNIPIVAQNDANLFTLAESWGGAGLLFQKQTNISFSGQVAIGITLGTGVGGGLVSTGKIYNGASGAGMEVGHISLNPFGQQCYCGQSGCAEIYLSGTGLNKKFSSREIFELARNGESEALQILANYRQHLLHFLSILSNLFNPHYFVFGGGISQQPVLFTDLKKELENKIFLGKDFCPEIYINQLGDSAGMFGAMIYAHEQLLS